VRWHSATDNEEVYGYEVMRSQADVDGPSSELHHHASVRAGSLRYEDTRVVSGMTYTYAVRPYDLAGNRGPLTASAVVRVPDET
jgi:hypothetical protein